MKVLVTGGAGFIGSHFVRTHRTHLPRARITVLDNLTYSGNLANLRPVADQIDFVHGDICDTGLVDEVVAGHDLIVHFAAETHVDRSILGAAAFVHTNVLGTQVLLEAARRQHVGRFVHVSTDEVYGSIETGSWTEDHPLEPNSPYAATKAGSDLLVRAYHRTHGLDVVLTRCSNNFGPYQYPEKVIPLFITNLLDGKRVPLYGDGKNVRDWLHVDDHCRAIALVAQRGRAGHTYNIGGGTELSNIELTQRILRACGAGWDQDVVEHVADRPGHDRRYAVDIAKISALGYAPRVDFATGLADTVAWYRANRDWWQPLKDRAAL